MENIKEIIKKYWWIVLIIVIVLLWYYSTQEAEKEAIEKKKKYTGGSAADCTEITNAQWAAERTAVLTWLDWHASPQYRTDISCIYWEKSGDVWTDIAYRWADDEIQRKGFCKPR